MKINSLWTEKYRPMKLEDLIIEESMRKSFESFRDGEIPNLLFCGSPGTGKTTLARVLVTDVLKCNYLYINASDDSGIDSVRTKISGFAKTKSFDGKIKVIILDEFDGVTKQAQGALRNIMEAYSHNTRFILTANYKHKITEPIQSRCQSFDIKPTIRECAARCISILQNEVISYDSEQKDALVVMIKNNFPDMRKIINNLQKWSIDGVLNISKMSDNYELCSNIHEMLKSKKLYDLRKFIIGSEIEFSNDYPTLLTNYLNFIYDTDIEEMKKMEVIIIISDHVYKSSIVIDQEINAYSCFIKISKALN